MAKAIRNPASRSVLVASPKATPCMSRMRKLSSPVASMAVSAVAMMATSISSDPAIV